MTARAMKKAETINQIVGLEKPLRAAETDLDVLPGARTRLAAQTAMATTATEPIGAALPMMAMIVATKTAARCQALGASPDGVGMIQTARPTAVATASGIRRTSPIAGARRVRCPCASPAALTGMPMLI